VERCQTFILIALGESIVVTGATASAAGLTSTVVLCLIVAFVETAALRWLYFGTTAEHARVRMSTCEDPVASPATPTRICTCRSSRASSPPLWPTIC
jgi:low temperature requirement protein LtrA